MIRRSQFQQQFGSARRQISERCRSTCLRFFRDQWSLEQSEEEEEEKELADAQARSFVCAGIESQCVVD